MKKSTVITVLIFLGLLAGVVLNMEPKIERGITRVSFAALDSSSIDQIVITGKNPIEMKHQDQGWVLGDGRRANANAVKRLVEAIPKIDSSELVTKNPDRFAEFEVDGEKGAGVAAYSQDHPVAEFTVGKSASDGAYVRIGNSVYLVKRVYPHVFSKKSSAWHKLDLFDAKLDWKKVTRVDLSPASGKPYALVKKNDKWEIEDPKAVPEGFRFDHSAASSLVMSLVLSRASDIIFDDPGVEKTGLGNGYDVLAFVDQAGKRHELHLGTATDKGDVYAKVVGRDDVYLLTKYSARKLKKQATDLRDMKIIDLDPEKVTRLSIADGKQTLVFEKQGSMWKIGKTSEKIPDGFELDDKLIERRLQALANAQAIKLSDDGSPAKTGLIRPVATVSAVLEEGPDVTLTFGKQTKTDDREAVYAQGNIDQAIYLVSKYSLTNLTSGLIAFKKRPAPQGGIPNLDPEALSNLPPDVRESLIKQAQQKQQQQKMIEAAISKIEKEKKKEKEKEKGKDSKL
jgi:hypothetical protein